MRLTLSVADVAHRYRGLHAKPDFVTADGAEHARALLARLRREHQRLSAAGTSVGKGFVFMPRCAQRHLLRVDVSSEAKALVDGLFRVCDSLNAELVQSSGILRAAAPSPSLPSARQPARPP